ncbi:hypothetical protein BKA65DRAFT_550493 [Rhexocercosporidium sp. MPI-PUGE-AT-0058]|nr:hypothetical protein BKA65DRAFT_550493 [Rhexocercosporidium sp. MPI-PUGE-AT-0058]
MDPVTILSLVCNICQLCEYGAAALVMAKEVYCSEKGLTEQHERLQSSTKSLEGLSGRLQASLRVITTGETQTDDEKNLNDLAAKCKEISCKILGLLEKIKGKKGHSFVAAMSVTVRDMRYRGKIEELQEKLRHLQDQVHLQLSVVLRSELLERLEILMKSGKSDASELALLRDHIQIIRAGVRVTDLDNKVSSQLLHLLNISSEGIDRKCQDYILKAISFQSMNRRYDQVETAHGDTFRWILENDNLEWEDVYGRKHQIAVGFRSWLSGGSGIFQIIAKPGSGKSTMMKVICDSPKTRQLLQQWAGGKPIIMAKFFFWKQDDPMQKSMDGMIRSLLHQVLSQASELIAECFPDKWRATQDTPWHSHLVPEISNTEAWQAFQKLFSRDNGRIWTSYSLCIFLDGLDECECKKGSQELIKNLQSLASLSASIKVCVSSRLMNCLKPIDDAFPGQKTYLHNLTESDVRRVVYDRLYGDTNFQRMSLKNEVDCRNTIDDVVQKAEGVFLWVTLILNILCQGLTDADTLSDLRKKIEHYPEDLDGFLKEIVKSIPTENRKLAYRTFACTMMMSRGNGNLRLLNFSFLEDYNEDRNFAIAMPLDSALSSDEIDARLARARRRLTAHCKELLHVDDTALGPKAPPVSFIHRSVREIFEQEQVKSNMAEHIEDFDVLDAILQTHLAVIKRGLDSNSYMHVVEKTLLELQELLKVIKVLQPRCTTATCESLDRLSTALLYKQGIVAEYFHEVEWLKYDINYRVVPSFKLQGLWSLVHAAAEVSLVTYLDWTVNRFPGFAKHHDAASELLGFYLDWSVKRVYDLSIEDHRWVESLLRRGLSANYRRYSIIDLIIEVEGQPIWHKMLTILIRGGLEVGNDSFWHIFETFVRYGADCSMTMVRTSSSAVEKIRWGGGVTIYIWEKNLPLGAVRLQDFVDFYKSENADSIKKLIVRNQTRERESPSIVTLSNRDFEEAWTAADKAGENVEKIKFRMREPNWDVSPPTAAELEAERFEKWATVWDISSDATAGGRAISVEKWVTDSRVADSSTFESKDASELVTEQTSLAVWMMGYAILGLPVLVMISSVNLLLWLPGIWIYLFSSELNAREL